MLDFIAIDFETANSKRNSACEVGIVAVERLAIVETFQSLIRPTTGTFNPINVSIHGITADMVRNERTLDELWGDISCYFESSVPVIAHNAAFDMSVLRESCSCDIPVFYYADSMSIAAPFVRGKKTLVNCADELGICVNQHHDALDDARVCAEICIEAFKRGGCASAWEYFCKNNIQINRFSRLSPAVSVDHEKRIDYSRSNKLDYHALQSTAVPDSNCPLCGKNIVFTGALSISRVEAARLAANHGAIVKSSVSRATGFLVVGAQDKAVVGGDGMSTKEEKAHALNESGDANIKIIGESEFAEMVREAAKI